MSRKRDRYSDDLSLTITNLCNATIIDKLIPGALWTLRILMEDEHGILLCQTKYILVNI
jgi:hypothetical protein